ncbi:hypothetical protein BgiBS90_027478 [Biomphalaria glabrata]|nr:hypothetical protein BgiBS90_027478 [Biomphalaria glabrata]
MDRTERELLKTTSVKETSKMNAELERAIINAERYGSSSQSLTSTDPESIYNIISFQPKLPKSDDNIEDVGSYSKRSETRARHLSWNQCTLDIVSYGN